MDILKYKDKVDKINAILLDPKMIATILGVGMFGDELGISMIIPSIVGKILIQGGVISLGSIIAYISGDFIKSVIESNDKEVK